MKIRKNSLLGIFVKLGFVVSFALLFAVPEISVVGIACYLLNFLVMWVTLTVDTYYIK